MSYEILNQRFIKRIEHLKEQRKGLQDFFMNFEDSNALFDMLIFFRGFTKQVEELEEDLENLEVHLGIRLQAVDVYYKEFVDNDFVVTDHVASFSSATIRKMVRSQEEDK